MICTTYFLTFFSELIPPTGKDLYKKKKKGTRVPSLIYTTHMRQEECCEPFVYFEATKQIDNESPVNYEQLYAQIMQKIKEV